MLAAKVFLVAVLAGLASGLPIATLLTWDLDFGLRLNAIARLLSLAMVGSFLIGLPVSLLTYQLLKADQQFGIRTLVLIANVAAVIVASLAGAAAGVFGLVFFGLPILIAANVFAVAGWLFIVKPTRANS
jgi:hypothetical protein